MTAAIKNKINIIVLTPIRVVIWFPIHNASPLVSKPFAKAIPPPNNNMIPQGKFLVSFHDINFLCLVLEGIKNSTKANTIAIIVSSMCGNIFLSRKERVIQQNAVAAKTKATAFSS